MGILNSILKNKDYLIKTKQLRIDGKRTRLYYIEQQTSKYYL